MRIDMSDFNWFVDNHIQLHEQYGTCYLAIHNKTVLGSYADMDTAIETTEQTIPSGQFIVEYCNGDEAAYGWSFGNMCLDSDLPIGRRIANGFKRVFRREKS